MKNLLRFICGSVAGALALGLVACTGVETPRSVVVATSSTSRAPDTYRPTGTGIPTAVPATPMTDKEKQDYGDYLGRYPGNWGPRG